MASALKGPGSEKFVEEAFAEYLRAEGWEVQRQVGYIDVVATKDGQKLIAEVKGRTGASQGLATSTRCLARSSGASLRSQIRNSAPPSSCLPTRFTWCAEFPLGSWTVWASRSIRWT